MRIRLFLRDYMREIMLLVPQDEFFEQTSAKAAELAVLGAIAEAEEIYHLLLQIPRYPEPAPRRPRGTGEFGPFGRHGTLGKHVKCLEIARRAIGPRRKRPELAATGLDRIMSDEDFDAGRARIWVDFDLFRSNALYLFAVPKIREKIPTLMRGGLMEKLGLSPEQIAEYAQYVLDTVQIRLDRGGRPRTIEEDYEGQSIKEILQSIDTNMKEPKSLEKLEDEELDVPETYLCDPLTQDEIEKLQSRLSRQLPPELIEALKVCDGLLTHRTRTGMLEIFAPSLEWSTESTADYPLYEELEISLFSENLSRRFKCLGEISWPRLERAISLNDGHKDINWDTPQVVIPEDVHRAREAFWKHYNDAKTSDEDRADLDLCIVARFGSRQVFDDMSWGILLTTWGSPSGTFFPSVRSWLCYLAWNSRLREDPSPRKEFGHLDITELVRV